MRLLEVNKFPPAAPEDKLRQRPYAILSHVWGEDELVFGDLHESEHDISVRTAQKIQGAQNQAMKDGLDYIWIDTLCIDKSSSAELGEAINSMYKWYQEATVCYVYLADLEGQEDYPPFRKDCPLTDADLRHGGETTSKRYWSALFREAIWFSRGWTLQELIAPSKLRFYDRKWNLIGDLRDLASTVSEITGIHLSMLHHTQTPSDFSIAQRICWAAGRETTRPEDRAYSLLGLLDMSIDIRYGEGDKAFKRLQEAIIERSADQSIFAWEKPFIIEEDVYVKGQGRRDSYIWSDDEWTELLAPSPDAFAGAHNIVPSSQPSLPYRMTNMGLQITAQVQRQGQEWMLLNCYDKEDPTKAMLLNLRCSRTYTQQKQHVTVGHVWLRQRALDQSLSPISRLSLMNVDQAVRLTTQEELFIATSRASSGRDDSMQSHVNVWLQIIGQREFEGLLLFNDSQPTLNSNTDSYTWTLERRDELPTPRPATLDVSLAHSRKAHPGEKPVNLHLDISHDHAFMCLAAPEKGRQLQSKVKIFLDKAPIQGNFEQRCQLKLSPGISVVASVQREFLNGQQWHILKVSTEPVAVHFRPLKDLWHSLKGTNCWAASGFD